MSTRDPYTPPKAEIGDPRSQGQFMRGVLRVARYAGVLLGAFGGLLSGVADLCGLVPHSDETPAFARRLLTNLPTLLVAGLLLLPYARVAVTGFWLGVLAGLAVATIALAVRTAQAMSGYLAGNLHWAAVPASLILLVVLSSNAFVLWQSRKQPDSPA